MNLHQQNNTSKIIPIFMADAADPKAGKTGLTVTVRICKNGGSFANGGGSVTEEEGGHYTYTPVAGDVDTLGPLVIRATATGAVDFGAAYRVVAFDPYSAASLGLTNLDAAISTRAATGAAMTLTSGERNTVADVVLTRDWVATVIAIGTIPARCMLNALRAIRNRVRTAAGVLHVYKEDDTTEAWDTTLTTSAGAEPIIESNPN